MEDSICGQSENRLATKDPHLRVKSHTKVINNALHKLARVESEYQFTHSGNVVRPGMLVGTTWESRQVDELLSGAMTKSIKGRWEARTAAALFRFAANTSCLYNNKSQSARLGKSHKTAKLKQKKKFSVTTQRLFVKCVIEQGGKGGKWGTLLSWLCPSILKKCVEHNYQLQALRGCCENGCGFVIYSLSG